MVVETPEPAIGNTAGDGVRHGACGILGGADGAPHRYILHSEGRPPRPIRTKEVGIEIRPGDVLVLESGGGGGWGDPARRDPDAGAREIENGFVTEAAPYPPIAGAMGPSLSPPVRSEGPHRRAPSPREAGRGPG
jgi:N-methylhydantoinase B